jgi:hypothetical protein
LIGVIATLVESVHGFAAHHLTADAELPFCTPDGDLYVVAAKTWHMPVKEKIRRIGRLEEQEKFERNWGGNQALPIQWV